MVHRLRNSRPWALVSVCAVVAGALSGCSQPVASFPEVVGDAGTEQSAEQPETTKSDVANAVFGACPELSMEGLNTNHWTITKPGLARLTGIGEIPIFIAYSGAPDSLQLSVDPSTGQGINDLIVWKCTFVPEDADFVVGDSPGAATNADEGTTSSATTEMPNLIGLTNQNLQTWLSSHNYKFRIWKKYVQADPPSACKVGVTGGVVGQGIKPGDPVTNTNAQSVDVLIDCPPYVP